VGILAGAFGGATLAEQAALRFEDAGIGEGPADALGVGFIVLGITFLSLVFGELVPKRIALAHPERIASVMSRPLRALGLAGRPVVALLGGSTNLVLGLLRIREDSDRSISAEELHMLLLESTRAGAIEAGEQEFASAALQLGDVDVSDVMTPRPEVTWLDLGDEVGANLALVAASTHHWFPVVDETADSVRGAVAVRDLFRASLNGASINLRSLVKPVAFLPESMSLLSALEQMRNHEVPLAIVIDEYGGTAGIVTMNDVVGAIVGDIGREANERPEVEPLGPGAYSIDGRAPLSRLEVILDFHGLAGSGEYQTLAGFVLHLLGQIPEVGETVHRESLRFEVTEMEGRRVSRVAVTKL
jgi:putative hemolysin